MSQLVWPAVQVLLPAIGGVLLALAAERAISRQLRGSTRTVGRSSQAAKLAGSIWSSSAAGFAAAGLLLVAGVLIAAGGPGWIADTPRLLGGLLGVTLIVAAVRLSGAGVEHKAKTDSVARVDQSATQFKQAA